MYAMMSKSAQRTKRVIKLKNLNYYSNPEKKSFATARLFTIHVLPDMLNFLFFPGFQKKIP
jgi:hypothetical protein